MSSPQRRVIVFPSITEGNPYQINFYKPLEDAGWKVRNWSLFRLVLSTELLHVHWPEAWAWADRWERLGRLLFIGLLPILKRAFGFRVLNTVHNLKPHSGFSRVGRWAYDRTLNTCDVFIHLSEAGKRLFLENRPELSVREHVVIPHPDYRPQLSDMSRSDARSKLELREEGKRFVFFGRVRPNKGVERLINSFREYDDMNASLWIGGKCAPDVERDIRESIVGDRRIEFTPGFIDEADMEAQVKAADWVVMPYSSGLNSGAVIYALSCGVRVLVPDSEVLRELHRLGGCTHMHFFEQHSFAHKFKEIVALPICENLKEFNLDALHGDDIKSKVLSFFVKL